MLLNTQTRCLGVALGVAGTVAALAFFIMLGNLYLDASEIFIKLQSERSDQHGIRV